MDATPASGFGPLPEVPVAGAFSEEEAVSIEQIAAVSRWMRHFSQLTPALEAGPGSPQA